MNQNEAKKYFYDLHDLVVNQRYNNKLGEIPLPYSFHIDMVDKQITKFIHLIKDINEEELRWKLLKVRIGGYGHDSIEDARLTYSDIEKMFGEQIAEIIFLCTEYTGRSRKERKPISWYEAIKANDLAVFVKLCDIVANVKFSLLTNSTMFDTYKKEYFSKVKPHLYREHYKEIFDYLESLFLIK